jgi:CheY-like chemotaxis protein
MAPEIPNILLIAASPLGVSSLVKRLNKWACEIHTCSSSQEARALVAKQSFDLVLSEFGLRGGSSCPLAASLIGTNATLLYSYPVETGCWWLPAVKNGQSCWGSPAMRPAEFIGFLEAFLAETRLRQALHSDEFSESLFEEMADQIVDENMQSQRMENNRTRRNADAA